MAVQRAGLHAEWRKFTNGEEEQRLIILDERLDRQELILADTRRDQTKIMNRAIRRMRRAQGKN